MKRILLFMVYAFCLKSHAAVQPDLALIYKGPGSCEQTKETQGCSEAAADRARAAGFLVKFVGPEEPVSDIFLGAKVWIQPGGRAKKQIESMHPRLIEEIKKFVFAGGGYVGFCAGGFLATEKFGWETDKEPFEANGIGLITGKSWYYDLFDDHLDINNLAVIIKTKWLGQPREIYWELGPYFERQTSEHEVVATYPALPNSKNQKEFILAMRGLAGKGRFYISATHPEAPQSWRDYYKIKDADGVDFDQAESMIKWVSEKQ